jgi:hypothetical protein
MSLNIYWDTQRKSKGGNKWEAQIHKKEEE